MTIKEMRLAAGISQRKLYELTGCFPSQISAWENGRRKPRRATREKIASACGFPGVTVTDPLKTSVEVPIAALRWAIAGIKAEFEAVARGRKKIHAEKKEELRLLYYTLKNKLDEAEEAARASMGEAIE